MGKIINKSSLNILFLSILFFLLLLFWELIVNKYDIPKRILPGPISIINYLHSDIESGKYTLIIKTLTSTRDALLGFGIAIILGLFFGITFSQSNILRHIFSPFTLITQLLPVPAFAPVIASVFGYGIETKILIIVLFTTFPVIVTVENAIERLSKNYKQLFSSYNAGKFEVIRYLLIPAIIPGLLTTMKILTTASIVTSIISELPLTVSGGIGKDIYNSFNNQITTRVWASLILISAVSIIFFYSVSFIEKNILQKYRYAKE